MTSRSFKRNAGMTRKYNVTALPPQLLDMYDLAFSSMKAVGDSYPPEQRSLILQADEAFHAGDPGTLVRWARDYVAPMTFRPSDAEAEATETSFDVPYLARRQYTDPPSMPLYAAFRYWNRVRHWGLCIPPASTGGGASLPGGTKRRMVAPPIRERGSSGGPVVSSSRKLVNEFGWTDSLIPALWDSWLELPRDTQDEMGTALDDAYGVHDSEDITIQELSRMVSLFWCARSAKSAVAMSEHTKRRADPTAVWPPPTVIRIEPDATARVPYTFAFNWWFEEKVTGLNGIVFVLPAGCPQGEVSSYTVVSGEKRLG